MSDTNVGGLPLLQAVNYQPPPMEHCAACGCNSKAPTGSPTGTVFSGLDSVAPSLVHSTSSTSQLSSSNGSGYSTGELRMMDTELSRARHHGELPRTSSSPTNTQATIEDYGYLTRLREARGDVSVPASESYNQLRVEVARRISERDSYLDEQDTQREASRRIDNYLRSVQQERAHFDVAGPSSPNGGSSNCEASAVDVETFSEEILSVVEQAADQTITGAIEALEPVLKELQQYMHFTNEHSGFIHKHSDTIKEYSNSIKGHAEVFERQHDTMDMMIHAMDYILEKSDNQRDTMGMMIRALEYLLEKGTENAQLKEQHLAVLSAATNHLSQVTMNLAPGINQIVYAAVQQHMHSLLSAMMTAQQQILLSLEAKCGV